MGIDDAATTPRDTWQDTVLLDGSARADAPAREASAAADGGVLEVRFTGSGSEYFRIWIVNLLLTLVTLGLYYPWAKLRKLRYFHANTLVGEHPLAFHGQPRTMLRGYLLVAALLALYSLAGQTSAAAGGFAVIVLATLWPALIKSSLQFRLANTSWRGLRLRFHGSTTGAYVALLPAVLPLAMFVALAGSAPARPSRGFGVVVLLTLLAAAATLPWLWFRLKRYQHAHYGFGAERSTLQCGSGAFYGVALRAVGVALAAGVVASVLLVLLSWAAGAAGAAGSAGAGTFAGMVLLAVLAWLGVLLLGLAVLKPYLIARLQNLVWSATASRHVAFDSRLRFRALALLTAKNWLLMLPTLGLYWPFAAVAIHRLRVEAVAVTLSIDPDQLVGDARRDDGEAAGDAAGDLFGLDIGF